MATDFLSACEPSMCGRKKFRKLSMPSATGEKSKAKNFLVAGIVNVSSCVKACNAPKANR